MALLGKPKKISPGTIGPHCVWQ